MTRITGTLEDLSNAQPNTDVLEKAMAGIAPGQHSDEISSRISTLSKGRKGGYSENHALAAETLFRDAIKKGVSDPQGVAKGLSPQFSGALNMAYSSPQATAMSQLFEALETQLNVQLDKSISLTSPLSTGLVPYDLVAPAKLLYPVYSPLRNQIPRIKGSGIAHQAKLITGISGSAPGQYGVNSNRMSITELNGGSLSGAYGQPPASGSQTSADITLPYKFFGLTESVSWLAQFAGQGFEDVQGLAALILMQESMMLEERAIIGATSVALSIPGAPGVAVRTPNSGEVSISGENTNVYVVVTALNYYGETVASAAGSHAVSGSEVVDVTISPVTGATNYNIYVGTGTTTPSNSGYHLMAQYVGANTFTLQGAIPTATATPPTADTGTAASTDYEGMLSAISGHSAGTVYPSGFKGSYVNQSVNDTLSVNAINNALYAMYNGPSGVYADPDTLLCEATDKGRFAAAMANANVGDAGYRFEVNQSEVSSLRAGAAIRTFVNPVTDKDISVTSHPYFAQGTAILASWELPQSQQNISRVWENVMCQDYLSITWPVVDVTRRQSLFFYGTLFSPAVQWNGLLQGIQKTVATSSSGTNS